jgi:antitoxin (DNA-binding transcriptional repressor) of toxin-antitoxin stability system
MTIVAMEQAQATLPQLIDVVVHGEHVVITRNQVPVAEIVPVVGLNPKPVFGSAKGMIEMSEDFDAPIDDSRVGGHPAFSFPT